MTDGLDVVMDDDATTGVTKYQNGLGIDDKLKLTNGGVSKYFLSDHLGSTVALTDVSGSVTASTSYDSFGNQSNTSFPSRYQYTGREYDAFSGLYYYRARWYDANLGRFVSEDPIGFGGGDVNLYGYVGNLPTAFGDPLGLFPIMGGTPVRIPRLPWNNGGEFADWGDRQVSNARDSFGGYDPPMSFNPLDPSNPRRLFETMSGFCDMFRVGRGLGDALYSTDENGWGRAAFVTMDAGRAAGLFTTMAGPFAGRFSTKPPNSPQRIPGFGDLTPEEIAGIQRVANDAGRPIEVVGSAARGARKPGSDIDYVVPPSSMPYFKGLEHRLPGLDRTHGIIPGYGNPNIGPVIRFEPGGSR